MEESQMSLNKTCLIGNLGVDPELRRFPDGGAKATFSIATTDKWKDRQSGEAREKTEWHRVVCHNGLAEIVAQYASKGRQVYVEGPSRTRDYQDKDGVTHYVTEVIAREVQFLGPKPNGEAKEQQQPRRPAPGSDDKDDDIPF
jgi:single-strand DNA-binding protein